MAKGEDMSKINRKWYEEKRELFENQNGERFYDLTKQDVQEIANIVAQEKGITISVRADKFNIIDGEYFSTAELYVNGELASSTVGSATKDELQTTTWASTALDIAKNRAIKEVLRLEFFECNLPKELKVVDQEAALVASPENLDLPEIEEPKVTVEEKPKKTRRKTASKKEEVAVKEEEKIEGEESLKVEEPVENKATKEEGTANDEVEQALNFVVKVGNAHYDDKSIRDILEMNAGSTFIKYYASRLNNPKFDKFQDFCKAAEIVINSIEVEGDRAKH